MSVRIYEHSRASGASISDIGILRQLTFSPLLAEHADSLSLQILLPYLRVDHDLLVLVQHHDVGAAEHEEAELVALLQPGANLGRQVDRGNEAYPDRQHGD